ncbi:MAG: hypothetical protein ACFBRM_09275 [Pikeienuella sp.]
MLPIARLARRIDRAVDWLEELLDRLEETDPDRFIFGENPEGTNGPAEAAPDQGACEKP